jgi:hypothetical protein
MNIVFFALFLIIGLVLLLGALFKWDWLFRTRKSHLLVEGTRFEQGQVLYGVIGIIMIVISLIIVLVPQVSQTITGKPDAMAILKVEDDGCTVTRSEPAGTTEVEHFLWVVTNPDYETVFTRAMDEDTTFKYAGDGNYAIVLQAWFNGEYVTISNKVKVNCTTQ